jgi:16S rRNA (guanine527-N7)-methyltransferase
MANYGFKEQDKNKILIDIPKAFDLLKLKQNAVKEDKLARYAQLILKWNKTYNLTALKNLQDIYTQHLYDSLSVIEPIEAYLKKQNIEEANIFDVGSGAGLPGVIISIMCPQINVVCIDSVGKKVAFVKHVASMLQLKNLNAQHQRIENWKTEPAEIVISRAFTSLVNFTKLAGMHVQNNGQMIAMKAHLSKDELEEFEQQELWQINHVENLFVPNMTAVRCLVWINKNEQHDGAQ